MFIYNVTTLGGKNSVLVRLLAHNGSGPAQTDRNRNTVEELTLCHPPQPESNDFVFVFARSRISATLLVPADKLITLCHNVGWHHGEEEEVNINDALVAFIERPVIGVRRSARLQQTEPQRRDYIVASLLQNEILQDAVLV